MEHNRYFMWIPILFAIGIGLYFMLPFEPSKWIVLGVLEILLVLIYLFRFRKGHILFFTAVGLIVLGFASIQLKTVYISSKLPEVEAKKLYLTGRIENIDKNYKGKQRIILTNMKNFDDEALVGKYRLTLVHKNNDLNVGDYVELVAEVGPLMNANMVGGFQFNRKLFYDGINGMGFVPSSVLKLESSDERFYFSDLVAKLRQSISNKIERILPKEEAAIAVALVAGNRNLMTDDLYNSYRDSGLAHFLSISGLHMSLIAGLMFFFVRLIMALIPTLTLKYNSKKVAAVFALMISLVYLIISGAAIPSQRAFIMTSVVLLAVLFERQAISMRTLALAALVVLIISPHALISASFQMSFAAVVALIAFYEKFAHRISNFMYNAESSVGMKFLRAMLVYVLGIIVTDLVASLATMPFAVYHFNKIAIYTTITNLLAGPIIGFVIMPFVMFALLLMPFGLEFLPLKIVGFGIGVVNKLTAYVASLPNATVEVMSFPLWGMVLITLGGLWLCVWHRRWRMWGLVAIFAGVVSLVTIVVPDVIVDEKAITIAVKNRDGKLIALKGGSKWNKEVWLSKYASLNKTVPEMYNGKLKVKRDGKYRISIDGETYSLKGTGGASFYVKDNKVIMKTVEQYAGDRPWNK